MPAAIVVGIVTPLVAPGASNPYLLSIGKPDAAAPAWMNEQFQEHLRVSRAASRKGSLRSCGRRWAGMGSARKIAASELVAAAKTLRKAPLGLQQTICVSLAIHSVSTPTQPWGVIF